MADWPIRFVYKSGDLTLNLHEPIPPGEPTEATVVVLDGRQTAIVVCPKCGEAGHCVGHDTQVSGGVLTVQPSIVCNCGGHYFLTNNVLREV